MFDTIFGMGSQLGNYVQHQLIPKLCGQFLSIQQYLPTVFECILTLDPVLELVFSMLFFVLWNCLLEASKPKKTSIQTCWKVGSFGMPCLPSNLRQASPWAPRCCPALLGVPGRPDRLLLCGGLMPAAEVCWGNSVRGGFGFFLFWCLTSWCCFKIGTLFSSSGCLFLRIFWE